MTTQATLRNRYAEDAVLTVSPAKLVLMLYDRLVKDLVDAEQAIKSGAMETASNRLLHAQDILMELHAGLKPDMWSGGPALASLYVWLHEELVAANAAKNVAKVATARRMVEPLRDAWYQAAARAETSDA